MCNPKKCEVKSPELNKLNCEFIYAMKFPVKLQMSRTVSNGPKLGPFFDIRKIYLTLIRSTIVFNGAIVVAYCCYCCYFFIGDDDNGDDDDNVRDEADS